jgi:uncharacterized cupredoxin-like copper-binding protein
MIRPLALLLALPFCLPAMRAAEGADRWAGAEVVSVTMVDDRFEPAQVSFHSGRPTELRLANRGKDLHEFTAPEFFRAATLRNRRPLSNAGAEVVVQPGKSVSVWLIPGKPGRYALICADHDWDGMIGSITVAE